MALIYAIGAVQQSAASNKPHYVGFQTARSAAHDTLFEVWNGPTVSGIKAAVDLNGKYYSAAWTAGDLPYIVAGGVSNVKRMDTLAIGSAGKILRSDGSIPAWSTATFPLTATAGDLLHASATNVWTSLAKGTALQVLQINAGGTLPEWTSSVLAAAGTLTGATLAAGVTASSLTSVGTLVNLTVTNPITGSVSGSAGSVSGNAATATALQNARTINGVSFDGTAPIVVTAAAGTLTGATLASGVTASSLTSFGTIVNLTVTNTLTAGAVSITTGISGVSLSVNSSAASVLRSDINGTPPVVVLKNLDQTAVTLHAVRLLYNMAHTTGGDITAGEINVVKEQEWTSTASTQDAKLQVKLSKDGTSILVLEILGSTGVIKIVSLAGSGSRTVVADANGVLTAP